MNILTVRLHDVLHICCRRPHPYSGNEKLNSLRPFDVKSQLNTPAVDKVIIDGDIGNKSVVNKVDCGRKRDLCFL